MRLGLHASFAWYEMTHRCDLTETLTPAVGTLWLLRALSTVGRYRYALSLLKLWLKVARYDYKGLQ